MSTHTAAIVTMDQKPFSLTRAAIRHWKLGILCIAIGSGAAALGTFCMPRLYEAEMKFLVTSERADLVLSPENNGPTQQIPEVSETQVNSEIELLKSRDLLDGIVQSGTLSRKSTQRESRTLSSPLDIAHDRQNLEQALNVSAIHKSNIIVVKYRNPRPEQAVSILLDLSARYFTAHLAAHNSRGTATFFSDEVQTLQAKLFDKQQAISDFRVRTQLYSGTEQRTGTLSALQTIDARLKELDAELSARQSQLAAAERQLDTTQERITTQVRSLPNQAAAQQLQAILTELRNHRIDLATKFQPTDRLITDVDAQIASTEQDMAKVAANSSQERTTDLDPVRQSVKSEYTLGGIAIQGVERQREELERARVGYVNQLSHLTLNGLSLERLEQQAKEAQESYDLYVHRLEESRLADALDRQKFANVVLVESPAASGMPVSPNLTLNLVVGAISGLVLFLALATLWDAAGTEQMSVMPVPVPVPVPDTSDLPSYQPAAGD
jgi:uncharacterized protein involved in exopolysaccharide biosynthesis